MCCRVNLEKQVENWSDKNLTKANKGKWALYVGQNNPITAQTVSKLSRRNLQLLMHTKLNTSQQHALAAQKPSDLHKPQGGKAIIPLSWASLRVTEVPRSVSGFSALEKTWCKGPSPVEDALYRWSWDHYLSSALAAQERASCCFQLLHGRTQRQCHQTLHTGTQGQNKRQQIERQSSN